MTQIGPVQVRRSTLLAVIGLDGEKPDRAGPDPRILGHGAQPGLQYTKKAPIPEVRGGSHRITINLRHLRNLRIPHPPRLRASA
jgi:hypothetical protein